MTNDYGVRVFLLAGDDAEVPALVRALHAQLCHKRRYSQLVHRGSVRESLGPPLCVRTYLVVMDWMADGQVQVTD